MSGSCAVAAKKRKRAALPSDLRSRVADIDKALESIAELRNDLALAKAALAPFAKMADGHDGLRKDGKIPMWSDHDHVGIFPQLGLVRAARSALERLSRW